MQRRKLMAHGLAAVGLASARATAQTATIANVADVAGKWSGRVEPIGVKLELEIQADGKFYISQTLQMTINNAGKAEIKKGVLVLPLPGGSIDLKLTPDGKLTGPYQGERVRGTATLSKG